MSGPSTLVCELPCNKEFDIKQLHDEVGQLLSEGFVIDAFLLAQKHMPQQAARFFVEAKTRHSKQPVAAPDCKQPVAAVVTTANDAFRLGVRADVSLSSSSACVRPTICLGLTCICPTTVR